MVLVGGTREFSVRLQQTGTHLRGLFMQASDVVEIEGDIAADGTAALSGVEPPASAKDGSASITGMKLGLSPDTGLQGSFVYETRTSPPVRRLLPWHDIRR